MTRAIHTPLVSALTQAFREVATGEVFTVVVNHFKSKGGCPPGGPDADASQGCRKAKRVAQAEALLDFVEMLKAQDGDVVIGDLNAYGDLAYQCRRAERAGLQHRVQDAGPVRADAVPEFGP